MRQLFYNYESDLHKRGAEMLELDVHLSQDEHVVVAHDQVSNPSTVYHILLYLQNLLRLTGEAVSIRERRLEDLPCLQSKVPWPLLWDTDLSLNTKVLTVTRFTSQVTIDFAPGKEFADLNLGAECRRFSTLDKV